MQLLLILALSCIMLLAFPLMKTRFAVFIAMLIYAGLIGFINKFFEDKK